jgi:uncharacterized membrane protein
VGSRDLLVTLAVWGPAAVIALVAALCVAFPSVLWDGFIFHYYWGPIVADAGGDAGGLTPDYNWIDTLSYGLILAWASFLIHRRFFRSDLRTGSAFFLSMVPIVIFGPAARVLEDMELFNEPLQYVFISPVIYIFLGITTLLAIETASRIERMRKKAGDVSASALILLPGLLLSFVLLAFPDQFNAHIPFYAVLGISALSAILYRVIFRKRTYESLVGWTWLTVLLFAGIAYAAWFIDRSFRDHYIDVTGNDPVTAHAGGGAVILVAVLISTVLIAGSLLILSRNKPGLRPLLIPVNVLIVSGHMLDASATWVGVDFYGYSEKHRLPSLLIENTGTAFVMYPLKLAFLLPAIYYIDSALGEDRGKDRHLLALIKLAILVLGFGPGIRDILRLSLGV